MICCSDYIAYSCIGHWDESVIKDISVKSCGNIIDESFQVIKNHYGESPLPGGGVKNINDKWYQVNILLIDGNILNVVCKSLNIIKCYS